MSAPGLQNNPTLIPVVAVALVAADGRVLLQQRRAGRAFAGLWEFPGGKVEAGESPESALLREIDEELGVALDPDGLVPLTFASDPRLPPVSRQPHVILLYICRAWTGEPRCLDAAALGWFEAKDLADLAMPPLDVPLARALAAAL